MGFQDSRLKRHVIDTFTSPTVQWVDFTFAGRLINRMGFWQLALFVQHGTVEVQVDSSLNNIGIYDPSSDTIKAGRGNFGSTLNDEKATLIHEGVHAILDGFYAGRNMHGQSAGPMSVLDDETMGYLAGAIFLVKAQGGGGTAGPTTRAAINVVRGRVDRTKPPSGWQPMAFSRSDVQSLQAAIRNDPKYQSTYMLRAKHDGFSRAAPTWPPP